MVGAARTRDVVVVGGGPAGSALAHRLASLGRDVLLLDRAEFPRRKPCGECVNPAAVRALDRLGVLPAVLAAHPAPLHGWRIGAGAEGFGGSFPRGESGFALPRAVLDRILLDHARAAGAEVRTGVRVTDLLRDESGAVAGVRGVDADGRPVEIPARLVVGADGLRSVVLRRLGLLKRGPRLRKLALTAHVTGMHDMGGRGELRVRGRECVGIADVGDGSANVTVVVTGGHAEGVRGHAADFFDDALRRHGIGAWRVDDVLATGPFDWPIRRAVADGALLVGDAAGYYDPFTGQGIYRALHGAELAARTVDAALRAGGVTSAALAPYDRARRRAFGAGERVQHVVEGVVSRPALFGAVAARFRRRPVLADAVIRVTGDVSPVRSLLRPSLLARLVW
ncbi:MAG: monooxygenase FAD-binding protein [Gemmatimonadetes bacterium]|nr:monooxygenase FAD-binding protein [Gemmatimonadota bacterium]